LAICKPIAALFFAAPLAVAAPHIAAADHAPLVYPNGVIVYGDWGLYRPGAIVPFAEGPYPYAYAAPSFGGSYFPTNLHDPAAYRSPIRREPIPLPAEPYYRQWGVQSDPAPATLPTPYEGPAVIYAPTFDGHHHKGKP
jgi:hypothetical protein